MNKKKILLAGAEIVPFASTGGLGDVLGSLPKALAKEYGDDADIRVVMPLYSAIGEKYREMMTLTAALEVELAWRRLYCGIHEFKLDNVTWYFIDNEYYFKRHSLYGHYDDGERYAFFSMAVVKLMEVLDFYPDVYHAHDWQTALTVIYLKTKFADNEKYRRIKTIFTIHNIEYQGVYDMSILGDVFALDSKYASIVENAGCINLMKGAVAVADKVSTVSPRYASEILTPEYSSGLEGILCANTYKLSGILNGIDYDYYNPAEDEEIVSKFDPAHYAAKQKNKLALMKELSLEGTKDTPMIAVISRLAHHKGLDMVAEIAYRMMNDNNCTFVLLGTGDPALERFFSGLEFAFPGRVKALITFNKALAKRIYASADIFLMPSRSEPCGLSQMIASRYGAVPVTRETGGLYDSIKNYTEQDGRVTGNGFTFADCSAEALYGRISAALDLYADKTKWKRLYRKVMNEDFSWSASAQKYVELYK
ncbi:MAG: glycogen synthase GlgA [Clostridia bacterium]|nr:glycogen synthase GlgA [Clostridia bacterium]